MNLTPKAFANCLVKFARKLGALSHFILAGIPNLEIKCSIKVLQIVVDVLSGIFQASIQPVPTSTATNSNSFFASVFGDVKTSISKESSAVLKGIGHSGTFPPLLYNLYT